MAKKYVCPHCGEELPEELIRSIGASNLGSVSSEAKREAARKRPSNLANIAKGREALAKLSPEERGARARAAAMARWKKRNKGGEK